MFRADTVICIAGYKIKYSHCPPEAPDLVEKIHQSKMPTTRRGMIKAYYRDL